MHNVSDWLYATVEDIDGSRHVFTSDSQDVNNVKEYVRGQEVNGECVDEYDSFFVLLGDGEYEQVWGMRGIIPDNDKSLYRVF